MRSRRRSVLCSAILALSLAPAASAEIQPLGGELRGNSDDSFKQRAPIAVFHNDGSMTAIWENDQLGIRARHFSAAGLAQGPDRTLIANQRLAGVPAVGPVVYHAQPAAAALPGGGFVLVWAEEHAILHVDAFQEWREVQHRDIVGQRFDDAGVAVGARFAVSADGVALHNRPTVTRSRRDLLVAWDSQHGEDNLSAHAGVFARRFNLAGSPFGAAVKLNDLAGATAVRAAVAANSEGRFLIAWEDCCSDGSKTVVARLLNRNGQPLAVSFRVNTTTVGAQRRPAVAAGTDNRFLVAWQGRFETVWDARIYGQIVTRQGGLAGGEVQISSGEQGGNAQISPVLAATPSGGYLAGWLDHSDSIFPIGFYARELDADGEAAGAEVKLSNRQPGAQFQVFLTGNGQGHYAGAWEGYLGEEQGVALQRFTLAGRDLGLSQGLAPAD